MKGKLKLKKKGKELKITLKGRGKDEANKKYRLRAIGSIESQALLLHFRVRGKAIKFEFDLDVALQNSATGLTVRFDQLIARSRQKNNLQGFGVVISPCSAEQSYGVESYSSSRVKIREKIRISKRKGLIRRRYLIRGDKFKLSMHNEMNSWDDPHMTVKRVKCRLGYGKIPLSYTNISLKYFWQIQNGDGGEP